MQEILIGTNKYIRYIWRNDIYGMNEINEYINIKMNK